MKRLLLPAAAALLCSSTLQAAPPAETASITPDEISQSAPNDFYAWLVFDSYQGTYTKTCYFVSTGVNQIGFLLYGTGSVTVNHNHGYPFTLTPSRPSYDLTFLPAGGKTDWYLECTGSNCELMVRSYEKPPLQGYSEIEMKMVDATPSPFAPTPEGIYRVAE